MTIPGHSAGMHHARSEWAAHDDAGSAAGGRGGGRSDQRPARARGVRRGSAASLHIGKTATLFMPKLLGGASGSGLPSSVGWPASASASASSGTDSVWRGASIPAMYRSVTRSSATSSSGSPAGPSRSAELLQPRPDLRRTRLAQRLLSHTASLRKGQRTPGMRQRGRSADPAWADRRCPDFAGSLTRGGMRCQGLARMSHRPERGTMSVKLQ